jgi:hypothetical protein
MKAKVVNLKQFPRTYSVDARTRHAIDAVALAPLSLVIAVGLLQLAGLTNKVRTPFALFAMGILAVLYAVVLSHSAHQRVILYEDGIEVWGWFSDRKLERPEILGRRMGGTGPRNVHGAFYIIVPTDNAARELRLPRFLHMDKEFFSWMKEIPNIKD